MYLKLQASQIDQEAIQITALQVIFDLLHLFGMETFNGDGNPEAEKPESQLDISGETDVTMTEPGQSGANKTASSVLNILIGLLDSQVLLYCYLFNHVTLYNMQITAKLNLCS